MDRTVTLGTSLPLRLRRDGARTLLCAPDVGIFTLALPVGTRVAEGEDAGVLTRLGRSIRLSIPDGVRGRVSNSAPERVHAPVEFDEVLYELQAIGGDADSRQKAPAASSGAHGALVLRATQSGRFYHRASPNDPPFAAIGTILAEGQPLGLIEVMKTFQHVSYRAIGGLPPRARLVRMLAADGADVRSGDALAEFAAASD